MFQIQQLPTNPNQQQNLILPDGTIITFSMQYYPQQQCWVMNLSYGAFQLNGVQITVNPNILRQFRNQIEFGLSCFSTSTLREPTQQQDFSSGLFQLNILSAEEVQEYEAFLSSNK